MQQPATKSCIVERRSPCSHLVMGGSAARRRHAPTSERVRRDRASQLDVAAVAWKRYGTPQRHGDYTRAEHDTWRRLLAGAEELVSRYESRLHPDYVEGFRQIILPWTSIPRLDEIDAALGRFGWRTLCVNGYLPPEVYSGLLARGIFPISREIRPLHHLEFSPTPDLAHDMLGHIPMLASAEHCQFLRRISQATAGIRPNALDRELYEAHRSMGALRNASPRRRRALASADARVTAAQHALAAAPSPLTRLDRMYLWSIEFGLMGTPSDFRIYGAGLLSSCGEVEALCTGNACIVDYCHAVIDRDIKFSDYQSIYFVARDYAHLNTVLTEIQDLADTPAADG
jgi:phenylalanine-4-hydroxylase